MQLINSFVKNYTNRTLSSLKFDINIAECYRYSGCFGIIQSDAKQDWVPQFCSTQFLRASRKTMQ